MQKSSRHRRGESVSFRKQHVFRSFAGLNMLFMGVLATDLTVPGRVLADNSANAFVTNPFGTNYFEIIGPDIDHVGWTPGLAPTSVEAEILDVSTARKGYFDIPGLSQGVDAAHDGLSKLYDSTGLLIGTAYTMLFQGLSGGPWPRYGGAGDFDLFTSWTLVGKQTDNTGTLLFDIEERFSIGSRTPNTLGAGIATLQPTANTFNDRGFVVRDFFWDQRLLQGQVRFIIGRADLTDSFGSTWMQTANNSFVNRMFASNPTVAGPGHGPAVGVAYKPTDCDFFISGGAANAYNTTTTTGFSTLDQCTFFSYGEVGWTPEFKIGEGRYTFSGWHVGERNLTGLPEDWGVSAIADQRFSEKIEAFARYGYSEAGTLDLRNYAQCGMGYRGLIANQMYDMTGLAFSYAWPHDRELRQEKVVESFYRAQVTRFMQFSVGAQAIIDPGDSPGHDLVGAFWGRVRIVF